MDPTDFLQIAKDLLRTNKAANCRTAFNRSYYAAYNVAVNLLEAADIRITRSSHGHEDVKRYLNNSGIQDLIEAQQKLVNLSNERIRADYRLKCKYVEKIDNAKKAVLRAEAIIQELNSHSSNSEKKKIKKAVDTYKQAVTLN